MNSKSLSCTCASKSWSNLTEIAFSHVLRINVVYQNSFLSLGRSKKHEGSILEFYMEISREFYRIDGSAEAIENIGSTLICQIEGDVWSELVERLRSDVPSTADESFRLLHFYKGCRIIYENMVRNNLLAVPLVLILENDMWRISSTLWKPQSTDGLTY